MTEDDDPAPDEFDEPLALCAWAIMQRADGTCALITYDANSRQYVQIKKYDNEFMAEADGAALLSGSYAIMDVVNNAVTVWPN